MATLVAISGLLSLGLGVPLPVAARPVGAVVARADAAAPSPAARPGAPDRARAAVRRPAPAPVRLDLRPDPDPPGTMPGPWRTVAPGVSGALGGVAVSTPAADDGRLGRRPSAGDELAAAVQARLQVPLAQGGALHLRPTRGGMTVTWRRQF